MRKRFEPQKTLDALPIEAVALNAKSRAAFPKLRAALQYIYITPTLNEAVFKRLEARILTGKKQTGRLGRSLWEILVLGTTRLCMDMDYDRLLDQSNNHSGLRGILGIETQAVFGPKKWYALQTLKDNVALLDESTLIALNELVVKAGHALKKKAHDPSKDADMDAVPVLNLPLNADTYVVESKVHFPTDLWLLWCSVRKSLDLLESLIAHHSEAGVAWRKRAYLRRKLKRAYLHSSNIHRKKGKDYRDRLESSVKTYLEISGHLLAKFNASEPIWKALGAALPSHLLKKILHYKSMIVKHIDLVNRRIILKEVIPHSEKLFSIFEPEVEWISKGKAHKSVELGHNVLVCRDQWGFIVDHQTVVKQSDTALVVPLIDRLVSRFDKKKGYVLDSLSFDSGFYSKAGEDYVKKHFAHAIMPKPGYKSAARQAAEKSPAFVALKNKHSAVESTINELEHSGVNKIPDKGLEGFKKYVAYGVLAFNLKKLGALLIEAQLLDTVVNAPRRVRQMPCPKPTKLAA